VMIFGSSARGDASASSDVDVLELAPQRATSYSVDGINISVYDKNTLREMAINGSLFVLHLVREGRTIRDPHGELRQCLDAYRAPVTYEPYYSALQDVLGLLDVSSDTYAPRWKVFNEAALYVVRSCLYARLAERGEPIFALETLRERVPSPELDTALALRGDTESNYDGFVAVRRYAEQLLGTPSRNPYGSIEAYMTNRSGTNPLVLAFGLRLLGASDCGLNYDMFAYPAAN
jgi:hypothetical protein